MRRGLRGGRFGGVLALWLALPGRLMNRCDTLRHCKLLGEVLGLGCTDMVPEGQMWRRRPGSDQTSSGGSLRRCFRHLETSVVGADVNGVGLDGSADYLHYWAASIDVHTGLWIG